MNFNENQPIYLQITEWIYDKILRRNWIEGDRIPSVRELGAQLEVNPNTVMRAYEKLQDQQIIFNKRGIGYFADPEARKKIQREQQRLFIQEELPRLFTRMELLGVTITEINTEYETFKTNRNENEQ